MLGGLTGNGRPAGEAGAKRPNQQELKLSAISDLEAHASQLQLMLRETASELELARAQIAALEREALEGRAQSDELRDVLAAVERERDAALAASGEAHTRAQELEPSDEHGLLLRAQSAVPSSHVARSESSDPDPAAELIGPADAQSGEDGVHTHDGHRAAPRCHEELRALLGARDESVRLLEAELRLARQQHAQQQRGDPQAHAAFDVERGGAVGGGGAAPQLSPNGALGTPACSRHGSSSVSTAGADEDDEDDEDEEEYAGEEEARHPGLRARASLAETRSEQQLVRLRQLAAKHLAEKRSAEENARMLTGRLQELHADLRELGSTLQTTSSEAAAARAAGAGAERRALCAELLGRAYLRGFLAHIEQARGRAPARGARGPAGTLGDDGGHRGQPARPAARAAVPGREAEGPASDSLL